MRRLLTIAGCILIVAVAMGCSNTPTTPGPLELRAPVAEQPAESNRYLWGYWTMYWNSSIQKLEAVPVRDAQLHLNIRRFLETTICKTCLIIGENSINADGDLEVKIEIIHPLTDPVFTGFDVRGIAIFPGTKMFDEMGLTISSYDKNEFTLVDPDGYTDLWSPSKFPPGWIGRPIFEYSKGTFASDKVINTTLNPFMAYDTLPERRIFQVGSNNTQTFVIRFPEIPPTDFVFGYAVDCSWAKPATMDNPDVPDDFPMNANSIEAYRINVSQEGIITPISGTTVLTIRVFDHQGLNTIDSVTIEAPDFLNGTLPATWVQDGPTYSEFEVSVANALNAEPGTYPVLVEVEDTATVEIIGKVNAYQVAMVQVHPVVELEQKILMSNFPLDSEFDSLTGNAYFGPVPLSPNLDVQGIGNDLGVITGFPTLTATGGIGMCRNTHQIFVASDLGPGWTEDITVFDSQLKEKDYYIDFPGSTNGPGPLDFAINENTLEVWVSLFNDNQVAYFPADDSTPDVKAIDVPAGPTTMLIDQPDYKVFAVCDTEDKLAIINGFAKTATSINLNTPVTSPDPLLPAFPGMAYIESLDRLYIATLLEGKVDYYDVSDAVYTDTIQVKPQGEEVITGLLYDLQSGYLLVTGQALTGKGHVYAIDPATNEIKATAETSAMNPTFPCMDSPNRRLFVPDPAGFVDVFLIN